MYFDGSDDVLFFSGTPGRDVNYNTGEFVAGGDDRFDFGSGDFTIEFWINSTASPDTFIVSRGTGAGSESTNAFFFRPSSSTKLRFGARIGGTTEDVISLTDIINANRWIHVAVGRIRDLMLIWVNGKVEDTEIVSGAVLTGAAIGPLTIGRYASGGDGNVTSADFQGHLDAFRISKTARYGYITAPTAALNTWQSAGRGNNALLPHHVKLLLQANSTWTTSTTPVDTTGNQTITVGGSTSLSQTQTKFGNVAFHSSWGTSPSAAANEFRIPFSTGEGTLAGTALGDWSWEIWMHASGAGTSWPIMMGSDGTTASTAGMGGFYLAFDGTGYFRYTSAAGGGTGINLNFPGNAFPKSQWNHVVSCRVAGDMYAFINGALVGQSKQQGVSLRTDINTNGIMIPWTGGGDGGDMYFDSFRVCVGESAYTPNFVPYGGQKNVAVGRGGAVTDARHPSANTHAIRMGQAAMGSTPATNANTYCLELDGTNDYIFRGPSDGSALGTFSHHNSGCTKS